MLASIIAFLLNSLTITVFVAYLFALWAALVVWTYIDISSRTDNYGYKVGATVLVATGAVLGFAIYLLLRPSYTKDEAATRELEEAAIIAQTQSLVCPSCNAGIREDFVYCPNCAMKLTGSCSSCKREVSVSWHFCPYCGYERKKVAPLPAAKPIKEEPAIVVSSISAPGRAKEKITLKKDSLFSGLGNLLGLRRKNVKKRSTTFAPNANKAKKNTLRSSRK